MRVIACRARSSRSVVGIGAAVGVVALLVAGPAAAGTATGAGGQTLSATPVSALDPAGATVTVTGRGYDETDGIYVAVCFDRGPGATPTPCIGGVDTGGATGASHWISSNPPAYGEGLAAPFGPGGTFTVRLSVVAADPIMGFDCRDPDARPQTAGARGCAVVTRADHTRTSDRSSDVLIPLTFAAGGPAGPAPADAPGAPAPAGPVAAGGGGAPVPGGGDTGGRDSGGGSTGNSGNAGSAAGNGGNDGNTGGADGAGVVAGTVATPLAVAEPRTGATAAATASTAAGVEASGTVNPAGTLATAPATSGFVDRQGIVFLATTAVAGLALLGSALANRRARRRRAPE